MIESLLEKEIGVSADAIGSGVIAKAVRLRVAACGSADIKTYLNHIKRSQEEQGNLIEAVVVPETWFFRNKNSFAFLANYITEEWLPEHKGDLLRVLSVPCSMGEEPYSIAMALMDAGIGGDRFHVDGVDISDAALDKAESGVYSQGSFRGDDLSFRKRYFEPKGDAYQLSADVRKKTRFIKGNVLDRRLFTGQEPYDIIFCRNLLIYMSSEAKRRVFEILDRLLATTGILFLGHAERQAAIEWGFAGIPEFGVFACRKERRKRENGLKPVLQVHPHPFQRQSEKAGKKPHVAPRLHPSVTIDEVFEPEISSEQPESNEPYEAQKDLFNEAQSLADQGSLLSALELCETFLGQNPAHVQAHFLMGLILEALDNEERAEEFFNKAIYLDPDHYESLNHLSFVVEHRGDREKAAHLRRRARRVSQKDKISNPDKLVKVQRKSRLQ
ncbi:MAG: tetratricopeptide repeat protein [Deltaproteobacteria bacterium]|uniref:Tetratricopeptide repeat protein n=1 Tax=Candidatus Desulfacyla euxinica TaxID=2841693 RepID=A0A8J6N311_9DELT|nr:tetratricopeptide repeat protein [Candidatus Desulfacyla euxinica]MBL7217119.1 tetratricopeptide repeat protein [Desulfobacteraceae bacterium]